MAQKVKKKDKGRATRGVAGGGGEGESNMVGG